MRDGRTTATFELDGIDGEKTLEVLGENRTLFSRDGSFSDQFENWDVHLYRFGPAKE